MRNSRQLLLPFVDDTMPVQMTNTDVFGFADALMLLREIQEPFLERLGHLNTEKDTLARYATALMIEVAEFANETPWKVWKNYDDLSQERRDLMAEEFADIIAFMGTWLNLLDLMGITPTMIAAAYFKKTQKNHDRFNGESGEAGYTGISRM